VLAPQGITETHTITYAYDPLYRLTAADYSTGESFAYQYDPVGNRVAMTDTTGTTFYTYDPANRLTSIQLPDSSIRAYTWDARGNLTHDSTFTYTYNAAGRMVQATSLTSTIVYTYSADGLRVAQNVDGVETTFAWDAVLSIAQVLATTEAGTANPTRYLHGVDLVAEYRESAWQYPLGDSLGSVRQVVDAARDVTYAAGYTPFGEVLWHAGEATTAWGFTGEWQDPNVGMIYLRARWYAPAVGRFTRQDPWRGSVQQPATGNPYAYGLNNPLTCTDPTGEWCLGGFDVGPGAGCTPEEREKWARIWTNVIDDAETASYFVLGFGVEVLDTLLLMGAGTLAKAYVEKLFAEYPVPELSLMLLLLDNDCNEFDLELYKALRDPYAFVDPGYLCGAAFARFILLFYGGASIFGGTGGLIAATVTGPPGWFFGGVSISVAAQGAAVIGIVIVKEIADPLMLTIAATGSPGGGGGGGSGGGGGGSGDGSSDNPSGLPDEAFEGLGDLTLEEARQIQKVVEEAEQPLWVVGSAAKGSRGPTSDIDYYFDFSLGQPRFDTRKLPGIDWHGILGFWTRERLGPGILFRPGKPPVFHP
jgi:RHS repeat-associated protein